MAEQDVKKLLQEVRESLERSQRMLEALEGRQGRRSSPPPPPPSPPVNTTPINVPTPPTGVSYTRRKTASYDVAYLSGEEEPRWESGERPATRAPVPSSAPPAPSQADAPRRGPSKSDPALADTSPEPPAPPVSQGRYTIIQERNARKPRLGRGRVSAWLALVACR